MARAPDPQSAGVTNASTLPAPQIGEHVSRIPAVGNVRVQSCPAAAQLRLLFGRYAHIVWVEAFLPGQVAEVEGWHGEAYIGPPRGQVKPVRAARRRRRRA